MSAVVRVGCSSWTSEAWWDRLYPRSLAEGERLAWYARLYPTVEIDSTFYAMPRGFLSERWRRTTPEGFRFAAKMTRELLDRKRPIDRGSIEQFVREISPLGPKLGPILLQFPPSFRPKEGSKFLGDLLEALPAGPRYAVELRDAGWYTEATLGELRPLLEGRSVALAWSFLSFVDVPPEVTTDFLYVRFIGDHTTVPSEVHGTLRVDRSEETRRWAERVRQRLESVREVFVFFNNHFAGFAPASVNLFREALQMPPIDYAPPSPSGGVQSRLD